MTAPTSEERREVAARLRENANKHGAVLDYLGGTQVASWWLLLHTIGCDSNEQEVAFNMLADLIDQTCTVVSERIHTGGFGCEEAGYEFTLSCGHTVIVDGDFPPSYCDECGARVVDDDDDQ